MSYAVRKSNSTPSKARCQFVTLGRSNSVSKQTELRYYINQGKHKDLEVYRLEVLQTTKFISSDTRSNMLSYYSWLTSFM